MDTMNPSPQQAGNQKPAWGKLALGAFSTPDQMAFIHTVYGWMSGGLVISALMALFVASTPAVANIVLGNPIVFYGLLIAEVAVVLFLSFRLQKLSGTTAGVLFLAYSALNGLTLSMVFFVYTLGSVSGIFLIAAAMFAGLSIYGHFTKTDLTKIGQLAGMALFGLIIAMVVNIFLQSQGFNLVLASIGVLLFTILTAYDTQKLKWLYAYGQANGGAEGEKRMAIQGALALYLDFINLFLELLQLFGKRR